MLTEGVRGDGGRRHEEPAPRAGAAAPASVGVIHNPQSRAGRSNRARFGAAAAGLPLAEPASRAELRDALRGFAARGVDLLAVQGGDGTLREVLTALPGAFGDRTPPAVAVLAAGKTNLAARALGGAGTGEAALRRLLDAAGRGALRRRLAPVLEVRRPGSDGDAPPLRGLLFGAAALAEGKRIAEAHLHRRGVHDAAAVALALAGVALRAGLDRRHPVRAGVPMRVAADGRPPREGRRFLLLATTLDRLMLGLRPFWGDGRGPVRWLDVEAPPRRLAAALWSGGRGKPEPWMAQAGYLSGRAERLEVRMDQPFVLDGEVFEPGPEGLLLSAPDRVAFVSP